MHCIPAALKLFYEDISWSEITLDAKCNEEAQQRNRLVTGVKSPCSTGDWSWSPFHFSLIYTQSQPWRTLFLFFSKPVETQPTRR